MQLGFDAKRLFNNFTGLGNYSRTLLRNLAEYAPEHAYHLFSPKASPSEETQFFFDNPSYAVIKPDRNRSLFWRSSGMKRDLVNRNIDLYHGLSHEVPLGLHKTGIPSVVTIHDLIFRHYPKQYRPWDNAIYNFKFSYACRHATAVVAISESTKQDIQRFFATPAEKIHVIYQSCDERFLLARPPSIKQEIRERYQLPSAFNLYVGSLIERKNLLGIIEALALLAPANRLPLVIVGSGKAYRKRVEQRAQELGVHHLLYFRRISFADLPTVYQCAAVFLYPSFYEGFGIPVIEALNSGVPVITSNCSSLPEAAGPNSKLIDPAQPVEIAVAWREIIEDSTLQEKMRTMGFTYAERFRAERVTPKMLALYQSITTAAQ